MRYVLTIRLEAELDIVEAYGYYENCRVGIGMDFVLCVEEALERITRNPMHYEEVHKGVRRAITRRYPYGIFYVVVESNIMVIAVMNNARATSRWQGRA